MATASDALLTAEQYRTLPDLGQPSELVRGRVELLKFRPLYAGWLCSNASYILGGFVQERGLGRVCNVSGVITEQNPDTVRAADVSFYSYDRLPKGRIPDGYLTVAPELVFLVRSADQRWPRILQKASEFLEIGVAYVCVLDPPTTTLTVYNTDKVSRVLMAEDELTLPALFDQSFRVSVSRFFAE